MPIRLGINGFGRIGRAALRAVTARHPNIDVVAINDVQSADYLAYQLKYDSVHGRFDGQLRAQSDALLIDGRRVALSAERDPSALHWGEHGVDLVIEASGQFLRAEQCRAHLAAGAAQVLMSAPAKDDTPMYVYGVNHRDYAGQAIASAASCTTNCLAPLAAVLEREWGIRRGLMTTVHAATASQNAVDGPSAKDWRGGRGVFENVIPAATGAARAVGAVLPALAGKLTGMAVRVPSADVSMVDLTAELAQPSSLEQIAAALREAAAGPMRGALEVCDEAVVSTDFRGHPVACVFDHGASIELDSTFFKLIAWYDNEVGYASNLLRLAEHLHAQRTAATAGVSPAAIA